MRGMLEKDFRLLMRNQRSFFVVVILIACMLILTGNKDFSIFSFSYLIFLVSYTAIGTISYDEYDNGMSFLMTTPIGRRTYVQEKYLFYFLFTGLIGIVFGLFCLCYYSVAFSDTGFMEILVSEIAGLFTTFTFFSVSIASYLKFGSEKGRMVVLMFLGGTGAFVIIGRTLFPEVLLWLIQSLKFGLEKHPALVAGCAAAACLLINAASYLVSLRIIERREF